MSLVSIARSDSSAAIVMGAAGMDTPGRAVVKCSQKWQAFTGPQQSKTVSAGIKTAFLGSSAIFCPSNSRWQPGLGL
jgi:hypothetical protein